MYMKPVIIKPYTFPDASCQARPPIPGIDPWLCPLPPDHTHRTKFSAEDLERLVRLAVDEEPWVKPCGQVMKSWNTILKKLQSEGRFQTSSTTTIQNKLNGLLAWQEDPNSSEGRSIARIMTSTSMMVLIGLLEKISASKAIAEKRVKDQKESSQKRADENREGGEVIREVSLKRMRTKRPRDASGEDSNQSASPSRGPKRRHCNTHDEKYDTIFELLKKVEERSERMELHAMENKREAFKQAQKALDSYNTLSERIIHAIVNIGGSNDVSK